MIRAESIGWTGCPWYHHTPFCRCSNAKSIALLQWRRGVPNRNTRPTLALGPWSEGTRLAIFFGLPRKVAVELRRYFGAQS